MEGLNVPNLPTQAAKPKKIKSESKTTSIVSQNIIVEKSTKSQPKGSAKVVKMGEGTGENQNTQKNKA